MTRENNRGHGSDTIHTLIGSRLNRLKYVWGLFLDPLATHSRTIFGINETYVCIYIYIHMYTTAKPYQKMSKNLQSRLFLQVEKKCIETEFCLFLIFKKHVSASIEQTVCTTWILTVLVSMR